MFIVLPSNIPLVFLPFIQVVIEVIYVLGFREGLWHLLGLILCAFCISANFVGLALLPGQAAWDDVFEKRKG